MILFHRQTGNQRCPRLLSLPFLLLSHPDTSKPIPQTEPFFYPMPTPIIAPWFSPFPNFFCRSCYIVLLLLFVNAPSLILYHCLSCHLSSCPTPSCWIFVTWSIFVPTFLMAHSGKLSFSFFFTFLLVIIHSENSLPAKNKKCGRVIWKTSTALSINVNITKWQFLLNIHRAILLRPSM